MHEIVKYFTLTEIHQQCLNSMPEPLIGPGRPAEVGAAWLPARGRRVRLQRWQNVVADKQIQILDTL